MENLNNILQLMGLNPDQLGPEKMKMLEIISKKLIEIQILILKLF